MKQNTSTTIYKVSNILGILGVLAFAVFAIFNTIPTAHAYYSQPSYNNNYRNGNWNNFNYNNYRQRPPQNIYNTQTPIYNYSNNYSGYHHDYDYGRSNNYSYPVTYPVYVPQYIPTQTYTPSYSYNYVPQYIPSYTPSYSNYYQYPTTYPTTYYQQPTQTTSYYQPITYQSNGNGLNVGCFADPSVASINEPVTWASEVTGGVAPYTYSWSGSDGISGTQNSVIKYYDTVGQKTAILTVTSADGLTSTHACDNTLTVQSGVVTENQYQGVPTGTQTTNPATSTEATTTNPNPAAVALSGASIPWGWIALLVILILIGSIIYLLIKRQRV